MRRLKKMKHLKIILLAVGGLILIYFAAMAYRTVTVVDKLVELRTDHFVISYQRIYEEEAQDIADNLEDRYDRIRTDLNDPHHEINRVFIHPTQEDFNQGTELFNSQANGASRGPNEFHFLLDNLV